MPSKTKPPSRKVARPPQKLAKKPVIDLFEKLGNKAVFISLGLLVLMSIIVFRDYLFSEKFYYFKDISSDSINGFYPYMYRIAAYMPEHGIPKWSFNYGLGQNLFPLTLRDPFDIILYIAGKDHILQATVYKEIAKIILSGLCFFAYLKVLKLSNFTAITGSLLYAFCGFMIEGSAWYIFTFEGFNLVLILLAFELLFMKGKWFLFPVAIFLMGISMPFNLYVYGIFILFYIILRLIQENRLKPKEIGTLFLQLSGLTILGLLLSAPLTLEIIHQLFQSPRGNANLKTIPSVPLFSLPSRLEFGTAVIRFFSTDFLGSGNSFRGWQNILEAPLFYCGLPCLLLTPQVFPFLDKKRRIAFIVILGLWVLPVIFPYFRHAFWLFTGNYYRAYSFFVALFCLYYSVTALDFITKEKKINWILLLATVFLLFVPLHSFFKTVGNNELRSFISVMLLLYAGLLFLITKLKNNASLKYIFLAALVVELVYLSGITANERVTLTQTDLSERTTYNDYSVDAINFIKQNDKGFYRIDKSYASSGAQFSSINDAMVQDYKGTSCYASFNNAAIVNYTLLMNLADTSTDNYKRWVLGLLARPVLESENGVKYVLAKERKLPFWEVSCDSIGKFGDVTVFRNRYSLPLGYSYSNCIKETDFARLSPAQKDLVSLKACVIKDKDWGRVAGASQFNLKDTIPLDSFSLDFYGQCVNELKKDTLVIQYFNENEIKGTIHTSSYKVMYLSIPYDEGWKIQVDGKAAEKIILNAGMTGIILPKGNHSIELSYHLLYFHKGLWLSFVGLLLYSGMFIYTKRKRTA